VGAGAGRGGAGGRCPTGQQGSAGRADHPSPADAGRLVGEGNGAHRNSPLDSHSRLAVLISWRCRAEEDRADAPSVGEDRPDAPSVGEERAELGGELLRHLLREMVAAVQRPASQVVRPASPHRVPGRMGAGMPMQQQDRRAGAAMSPAAALPPRRPPGPRRNHRTSSLPLLPGFLAWPQPNRSRCPPASSSAARPARSGVQQVQAPGWAMDAWRSRSPRALRW